LSPIEGRITAIADVFDAIVSRRVYKAAVPFDRAIDNQVSRLRKKIELDPRNPALIKTHWGGGYSFTAEVTPA